MPSALRRVLLGSALLPVALVALGGCSLILDFSELPDAGPSDDAPDPCAAYEPNDSTAAAFSLEAPADVAAAICIADPTDIDYYRFEAPGGQDATVVLTMMDGTGPTSLGLRLLDSFDGVVAEQDTFMPEESVVGTALTAGTYYIEVAGTAPGNSNAYQLTLSLTAP